MQLESWEEVVGCGDDKLMSFLRGRMIRWYGAQYNRFIDYKNEELLLTDEAITTDMHAFSDVQPLTTDESSTFEIAMRKTMDEFALAEYVSCPDSAMVLPLPNTSGGLTAYITAYAAINRNSEYAGDAFSLIELMLSDEVQSDIRYTRGQHGHYIQLRQRMQTVHYLIGLCQRRGDREECVFRGGESLSCRFG